MTKFHAVVWLDHTRAQILEFDAEHVQARQVKAHPHPTAQHGSQVRSVHAFHAALCDALAPIPEVLVTGGKTALADLRHYIEKHRPQLAPHIAGWQTVDHPSDAQLVALARQYFLKHDRMAGVPTPT